LKGYEEYEAIRLLLPSCPPDDQNGHGFFFLKRAKKLTSNGSELEYIILTEIS